MVASEITRFPGADQLLLLELTLPTTLATEVSAKVPVNVAFRAGMLYRVDLAIAEGVDATITLRIYTKAGEAVGSAYQLVALTGLTGGVHTILQTLFHNFDVPRAAVLYLEVEHTAGADETGEIPIILWITA